LVSSFVGKKERRKGEKERRKQRGIELILGMEAKDESDLDKEIVTVAIEGRDRTESKWKLMEGIREGGFVCRDGDAVKGRERIWDEISVIKDHIHQLKKNKK